MVLTPTIIIIIIVQHNPTLLIAVAQFGGRVTAAVLCAVRGLLK